MPMSACSTIIREVLSNLDYTLQIVLLYDVNVSTEHVIAMFYSLGYGTGMDCVIVMVVHVIGIQVYSNIRQEDTESEMR